MPKQKTSATPQAWLIVVLALFFIMVAGGVIWYFRSNITPAGLSPTSTLNPTTEPSPTSTLSPTTEPRPTSTLSPTPTPTPATVSISEAFDRGLVKGEFYGRDCASGECITLTIRRAITREVSIDIPCGTLLLSDIQEEPDMVVRRVRGETIRLSDDAWHEYVLEAYSLDFNKGIASSRATFFPYDPLPSEVLRVLREANRISLHNPRAIQIAIWAITFGIDQKDLDSSDRNTSDLATAEDLFVGAGLDPKRKRLFDETEFESAQGYIMRGNDYYQMGEYTQAVADYTQAIEMESDYAEVFYKRGLALVQKREFDLAIADFKKVTNLLPQYPHGYFALGITFNSKPDPDYDQAITNLNEAIRLDQNFVGAYFARGQAYAAKEDFDQAINNFTWAVDLDTQFVDAYYARGTVHFSKQDFLHAINDFTKVIGLDSTFAEAFLARGQSYSAIEEQALAIQDFQKYLALMPEAVDRQEIEGLIAALRGNVPTPAPGQVVSLVDAINQGWIQGEFRGLGISSGDSIRLTVQRAINQEMFIVVPLGLVLSSNASTESNMVVRRLRGLALSEIEMQSTEIIHLADDESQEYFVEAYSLEFYKADPSPTTVFSINGFADPELLQVLKAVDLVPRAVGDIIAIQTVIWVITDNVNHSDLEAIGLGPELQVVKGVLRAAGLDPQCTRLFGGVTCTPVATETP